MLDRRSRPHPTTSVAGVTLNDRRRLLLGARNETQAPLHCVSGNGGKRRRRRLLRPTASRFGHRRRSRPSLHGASRHPHGPDDRIPDLRYPARPASRHRREAHNGQREASILFRAAGARSGFPPSLIEAIAYLENWGDPKAESPSGARGIMQISAATARTMGLRVTLGLASNPSPLRKHFPGGDPNQEQQQRDIHVPI
jgi:hypothetical protein